MLDCESLALRPFSMAILTSGTLRDSPDQTQKSSSSSQEQTQASFGLMEVCEQTVPVDLDEVELRCTAGDEELGRSCGHVER